MYRFLIYISNTYAYPIGEPLYQEIKRRGYNVKWFADKESTKKSYPFSEDLIETIQEAVAYNPDIILAATDVVPDFFRGLKVQVFHGFNAEKRSFAKDHFRIRQLFDLYCTQGPSTTSIFNLLKEKHKTFEVKETGWSKVDSLFKGKITPEPNSVLISTTFTKRLSLALNDFVYDEIKRLSKLGKYKFRMIMHPLLGDEVKAKWAKLNGEDFEFIDTTYLNQILQESAIMLSDTTSVIQEFLLLDRPVVTINHFVPKDYLINISSAEEIEGALDKAMIYPNELSSKITAFTSQLHPYNDGNSSQRVIDASIEYLQADKSYIKTKPWNLIRKWKLRKILNYYPLKSYNRPYTLKE